MRRPSPALVVAVIALIVAMSGTSYAVSQLPRNTVGAVHLKRNAVTAAKIKRSAVTTAKIRRNAITGAKVRDGSLTAADFSQGTVLEGAPSATVFKLLQTPLRDSYTEVLRLSEASSGNGAITSTGPITVSAPSRLIINATVEVQASGWVGLGVGGISCRASVSRNGVAVPTDQRGYDGSDAWSYGMIPTGSGGTGLAIFLGVPITRSATVGPGTYDVAIGCQLLGASGIVVQSSLIVVAAGQ